MVVIYFSGTGNTEYIAKRFAAKVGCKCFSIEDKADFVSEIQASGTIALAYPIYSSRAPRIMREFAKRHASNLCGKKLVIFVTQMMFSGDGARSFTDLFKRGHVDVIYAEHFQMPNNVCNFSILKPSRSTIRKCVIHAEAKLERAYREIRSGTIRRKGFNKTSRFLGLFQSVPWLAGIEHVLRRDIRISKHCTSCELCTKICPIGNLRMRRGKIVHKNNCTVCYRCVNRCPSRAITVMFHWKPPWQYNPIISRHSPLASSRACPGIP